MAIELAFALGGFWLEGGQQVRLEPVEPVRAADESEDDAGLDVPELDNG